MRWEEAARSDGLLSAGAVNNAWVPARAPRELTPHQRSLAHQGAAGNFQLG